MNRLASILPAAQVLVSVDATSKKRAFEEAGLLFENLHGLSRALITDSLFARERLGSTGLGHGVAIPHGRIKGLKAPMAAVFQLERPIGFDAPDEQPVGLLIFLLVPEAATQKHLEILSEIAELLSDAPLRERARKVFRRGAEQGGQLLLLEIQGQRAGVVLHRCGFQEPVRQTLGRQPEFLILQEFHHAAIALGKFRDNGIGEVGILPEHGAQCIGRQQQYARLEQRLCGFQIRLIQDGSGENEGRGRTNDFDRGLPSIVRREELDAAFDQNMQEIGPASFLDQKRIRRIAMQ